MSNTQMPAYFDANATTPLDPRVLEAMMPYFREHFGNAESSQHPYGWKAKLAVDKARAQVASLIGAKSDEIIFTSGSSESLNLGILGFLETQAPGRHLISTNAEHKATLETLARATKRDGHTLTLLPVDRYGQINAHDVIHALRPNTALVTLMHANNEVGSINPIAKIGEVVRAHGAVFHVDAAQTVGKVEIDVGSMNIDMLSLSAHKFHGPKGIGALYLRRKPVDGRESIHLHPLISGGGQERGLRSGTHNVPGIVGLGEACEIAAKEMKQEVARLTFLRDKIIAAVVGSSIELNGHPTERLCNNVHLSFRGVSGDRLITGLQGYAFSSASACSAGAASHVLKAMLRASDDPSISVARFGLSRFTRTEEVDGLIRALQALRSAV